MDIAAVRGRFGSLGSGFTYLDAPGGSQVPDEVGRAVLEAFRDASGNVGFPYASSQRAERIVEDARGAAAGFLGCMSEEVIFGANMTSLNFMLTRTLGRGLKAGDEVVTTRLDHDANVAPWLDLAQDIGIVVKQVDVQSDTTLDYDHLVSLMSERTKVVAFPWASNAVGTVVDAAKVCRIAHEVGALAWVDAVQFAPHKPIDVGAIDADVLLCSAYKFCGPHVGVAFGKKSLLESLRPYKARPSGMEPVGHRFETGTLPYELLAALVAAFRYIDSLGGMPELALWEERLGECMLAQLESLEADVHGLQTMSGRVPTFLVSFADVPASELSRALADRGFGVWSSTSYYAVGLYERLQWGEALRIGLAHYNSLEEVERFGETLGNLIGGWRG